eukprot:CAMPEP_0175134172 /NCGR_PEP_ID=MMETSP0087-20121206/8042_1 /TAXON_ID=136419 /ORGANISM="Unknown Unknown, Strain D1" /LENGTH=396 /DNA_ID=CAMNT_0016416727 /DNA_START=37 /DNA_END=1227 /DNA_ORIENTATION=+
MRGLILIVLAAAETSYVAAQSLSEEIPTDTLAIVLATVAGMFFFVTQMLKYYTDFLKVGKVDVGAKSYIGPLTWIKDIIALAEDLVGLFLLEEDSHSFAALFLVIFSLPIGQGIADYVSIKAKAGSSIALIVEILFEIVQAVLYMYFSNWLAPATYLFPVLGAVQIACAGCDFFKANAESDSKEPENLQNWKCLKNMTPDVYFVVLGLKNHVLDNLPGFAYVFYAASSPFRTKWFEFTLVIVLWARAQHDSERQGSFLAGTNQVKATELAKDVKASYCGLFLAFATCLYGVFTCVLTTYYVFPAYALWRVDSVPADGAEFDLDFLLPYIEAVPYLNTTDYAFSATNGNSYDFIMCCLNLATFAMGFCSIVACCKARSSAGNAKDRNQIEMNDALSV